MHKKEKKQRTLRKIFWEQAVLKLTSRGDERIEILVNSCLRILDRIEMSISKVLCSVATGKGEPCHSQVTRLNLDSVLMRK